MAQLTDPHGRAGVQLNRPLQVPNNRLRRRLPGPHTSLPSKRTRTPIRIPEGFDRFYRSAERCGTATRMLDPNAVPVTCRTLGHLHIPFDHRFTKFLTRDNGSVEFQKAVAVRPEAIVEVTPHRPPWTYGKFLEGRFNFACGIVGSGVLKHSGSQLFLLVGEL